MKTVAIIPARLNSTRFPEKVLVNIHGKTMLRWVYDSLKLSKEVNDIYIATDDHRIIDEVLDFGGKVLFVPNAENGTERCIKGYQQLNEEFDILINVQADQPTLRYNVIDNLIKFMKGNGSYYDIATIITDIKSNDLGNKNVVKTIVNHQDTIFFSRENLSLYDYNKVFKHIGVYGFKTKVLNQLLNLSESVNEKSEKLEQLRWVDAGFEIGTIKTSIDIISIDVPEDLDKIDVWLCGN